MSDPTMWGSYCRSQQKAMGCLHSVSRMMTGCLVFLFYIAVVLLVAIGLKEVFSG